MKYNLQTTTRQIVKSVYKQRNDLLAQLKTCEYKSTESLDYLLTNQLTEKETRLIRSMLESNSLNASQMRSLINRLKIKNFNLNKTLNYMLVANESQSIGKLVNAKEEKLNRLNLILKMPNR